MNNIRETLDAAPMGRRQIFAVAVAAMISGMDGYDILAVTFAAPSIYTEFGINKSELGIILSASLLGMGLGGLFLAPIADFVGRRSLAIASLLVMTVGMLACALAWDHWSLAFFRLVTGLGIGIMMALIPVLVAEYANARRRALAIAIASSGYAVGAVIGGAIVAELLEIYGWRAAFYIGSLGTALLVPLALLYLPESIDFLAEGRTKKSLERLNAVLRAFGHVPIDTLPLPTVLKVKPSTLVSTDLIKPFALVGLAYFTYAWTFFFFLSWMPQLIVEAGFSTSQAVSVSIWSNLLGILGGLILGWLAPAFGLNRLTGVALFLMAFLVAAFTFAVDGNLMAIRLVCGGAYLAVSASIAGLYTIIAGTFPVLVRSTALGVITGLGRGLSALAPAAAGLLYDAGVSGGHVGLLMAAGAAISAVLILTMQPQRSFDR